jgi:tRNA (cytidine32/uridine32-2'-O)-methyltransferase
VSLDLLAKVKVVLVHTSHPGNIGGAARAMKNMGLQRLTLVKPKRFPDDEAVWRSAGATDVLEKAVVVETLEEALADCSLVVGTSARDRRIPWPVIDPRECAEQVTPQLANQKMALVFGREDRGLTNEELHKCNFHVHIPTNSEYSSLNLAAAVQVLSYELRMACLHQDSSASQPTREWDRPYATAGELELFYQHLEQTLIEIDFLDPGNPRQLMARLKRLYSRVRPDRMEVNILRGMLTAVQKYGAGNHQTD